MLASEDFIQILPVSMIFFTKSKYWYSSWSARVLLPFDVLLFSCSLSAIFVACVGAFLALANPSNDFSKWNRKRIIWRECLCLTSSDQVLHDIIRAKCHPRIDRHSKIIVDYYYFCVFSLVFMLHL